MKRLFNHSYLFFVVLILALLAPFSPLNVLADNFQAGDLVKSPGNPAVYYYGYDGKRHAFPNEQTYYSWYQDFGRVKVISQKTLQALPLGKNIVIRPGTYLVKFPNSSKVYAVEPLGRLRHLLNPQIARALYGESWGHKIVHLPEHLFSDYSEAGLLARKEHTTGSIIKYKGDPNYYLITNNFTRRLASVAKWENYRFNNYFVHSVDRNQIDYEPGYDVDYFKVSISDTAQTLIEEEINDYLYYVKIDPTLQLSPVPRGGGTGLTARYYESGDLRGSYVKREDAEINFDWGWDPPFSGMTQDFSVRWTGKIEIPETSEVPFFIHSDDGARLYIDDKLVIDNWQDQRSAWTEGKAQLTSGLHDITIEYYDAGYDALMQLAWQNKNTIIPTFYLYPEE